MHYIIRILIYVIVLASVAHSLSVTLKHDSNIRKTPSYTGKKVTSLKKNTQVDIQFSVENKKGELWCKIKQGYILQKLLRIKDSTKIPKKRYIEFLTSKQLQKLLVSKLRVGRTRYSKNGSYYESFFYPNGKVQVALYKKDGSKIKDIQNLRWIIKNDNSFCTGTDENINNSCRKVFKKNAKYVSILKSDGKVFSIFEVK